MAATNNSINSVIIGPALKSAFNELMVAQVTAVSQIQFPYNINQAIVNVTLTGLGSVTQNNSMALIQSGATTSSSGQIMSREVVHYLAGQGLLCLFSCVYGVPTAGNTQLSGIGDNSNGFFFGYNGTTFGILHRNNGTDNFIPQSDWNVDKLDGTGISGVTLNQSTGNIYKIQFLGFGSIKFFIEDSNTGNFDLVHIIQYSNENIVPSVGNPNLNLFCESKNTSNTSNVIISIGSMSAFVEGLISNIGTKNSISNTKTINATQSNIITIRNNNTFVGKPNKTRLIFDKISLLNDSNSGVVVRMWLNPIVTGIPVFTDINSNTSCASYDTAGLIVSGGTLFMNFFISDKSNLDINLKDFDIRLFSNERFVFSGQSLAGAASVSVGLSWRVDF